MRVRVMKRVIRKKEKVSFDVVYIKFNIPPGYRLELETSTAILPLNVYLGVGRCEASSVVWYAMGQCFPVLEGGVIVWSVQLLMYVWMDELSYACIPANESQSTEYRVQNETAQLTRVYYYWCNYYF